MSLRGRRIAIEGTVQGVGFRPWVFRLAREEGLAGRVRNDAGGVVIEAFGEPEALDAFLRRLEAAPPPAARIRHLHWDEIPGEVAERFVIDASDSSAEVRISIPPDLATCEDCLRELFDPEDRRYRYPFINCTHCGPRFTIALAVPYDRATTSMRAFTMCPACRSEYESPGDRRFHAQPNACPACGPRLELLDGDGVELTVPDVVAAAAEALRSGLVVAIKGLGGFHLACDATDEVAVERLRSRKRRDHKPFAVMVEDLDAARRLAVLSDAEERLLTSVERPIVLARRQGGSGLAPQVAPQNRLVGLLLPYTPLHHLLLREVDRALVMTSGNPSDEPIASDNDEAVRRLGGVADRFLVHDREIVSRCDDSVARVIAERPVVFRRARGFVPRPVPLKRPVARPVLACGAHLKNTFCLAVGTNAYLGPHIGDLETLETFEAFQAAVERLEAFLDVEPEVVAYDLHPHYLATEYALRRDAPRKVGVQHHHAHVTSAMAEHGLEGPVLGLAYDGTGYGPDGAAWGGELLLADAAGYRRLATFRPIRLAGGDQAIRQIWRLALALLDDAFDGAPPLAELGLFRAVPAKRLETVRRMIEMRLRSPLAHGVGRYFDALGALVLERPVSHHEGQVALEWNLVASPTEARAYPYRIDRGADPWQVDLRPLVRCVVQDHLAAVPAGLISARFHNALAAASEELVRRAVEGIDGEPPVILTGGCFQNARLAEDTLSRLRSHFEVFLHGEIPPGDGGLALGQVLVADAVARAEGEASTCV